MPASTKASAPPNAASAPVAGVTKPILTGRLAELRELFRQPAMEKAVSAEVAMNLRRERFEIGPAGICHQFNAFVATGGHG